MPSLNIAESPLAWLARRKDKHGSPLLSQEQVAAGERLRRDFEFGQMSARVTINWQRAELGTPGGGRGGPAALDLSQSATDAQDRVRRALVAVGPEFSNILLDICCFLRGLEDIERSVGWPQRSGKIVLGLALNALARHYGLRQPDLAAAPGRAAPVRHWGSADYRPVVALEPE